MSVSSLGEFGKPIFNFNFANWLRVLPLHGLFSRVVSEG